MTQPRGTTRSRPRASAVPPARRPAASRSTAGRPQRAAASAPAPVRAPRVMRWVRLGNPDRRLRGVLVVVLFVLSLFVGRLLQIQGLDASALAKEALGNRLVTVPLEASRGTIVDASGTVLATTVDRRNVAVDQTLVSAYKRKDGDKLVTVGIAGAAEDLSPLLGKDVPTLTSLLTGHKRFQYLAKGISPELWREVAALGIPGVSSESASQRLYPSGPVAANLLGFVSADGKSTSGLEQQYNSILKGTDGWIRYERDPSGAMIPTGENDERAAQQGGSVQLTIDRDLQWKAQQAITAKVSETGAASGTVVVMDVHTGDVLAMATAPTFDPNNFGRYPASTLGNAALSDVFEPGSTGKVMTMAAALQEGVTTPDSTWDVPNVLVRNKNPFHDAENHGLEHLTTTGVLAKSSNIGTIEIGEKMSKETIYNYFSKFGVGQPTGLKFPGEQAGTLAPPGAWDGLQRYTVLFGQGLSVNAVQTAGVFQTIANNGVRVAPRLVKGWTTSDGVKHVAPAPATTTVVSPQTATTLRQMMEAVVSPDGTAPEAQIPGYRVAGKTGTAQRYDSSCHCYRGYTGSFIGFAPADSPQIVVAVSLQNPVNGHFGGVIAAPVFKDVMTFALAQRQVPPTATKPPVMRLDAG